MKRFFCLIFLMLSGCFSHNAEPNLEDTVLVGEQNNQELAKLEADHSNEPWYGLYDQKDVVMRVYFEYNRATVSERDKAILRSQITPLLERFKELPILLAGYTDWNGQETYNEKLGHQRAQAVADVLSQAGIPTERMETISLGKTCATPNIDQQAAYQDRRCDVVLKKQR
ncbi:MAG TPA: hypothetical protein DEW74_01255 [Opitutae bacterium]|nr:hypothetical protein [Opitutae bacterium]